MIRLLAMTGQTDLTRAGIARQEAGSVTAGARTGQVYRNRMRIRRRCLMTGGALTHGLVMIHVTPGARFGRHRHGECNRMARCTRDFRVLTMIE
jgi:hypothetical protein